MAVEIYKAVFFFSQMVIYYCGNLRSPCLTLPVVVCLYLFGAVWGLLLWQLKLTMLVLARSLFLFFVLLLLWVRLALILTVYFISLSYLFIVLFVSLVSFQFTSFGLCGTCPCGSLGSPCLSLPVVVCLYLFRAVYGLLRLLLLATLVLAHHCLILSFSIIVIWDSLGSFVHCFSRH